MVQDASNFSSSGGSGSIDHYFFQWSGKNGNTLTGCTHIQKSHDAGVAVISEDVKGLTDYLNIKQMNEQGNIHHILNRYQGTDKYHYDSLIKSTQYFCTTDGEIYPESRDVSFNLTNAFKNLRNSWLTKIYDNPINDNFIENSHTALAYTPPSECENNNQQTCQNNCGCPGGVLTLASTSGFSNSGEGLVGSGANSMYFSWKG